MSPPERVAGYELLEELGRGGFGAVWRARDPRGGEVALKLLHPAGWLEQGERERFLREAQALLRVQAPGLVRLLDAGLSGARPYLVMELVPGETLAAVLKRGERLAPPVALGIARELCGTLAALHAQGVVHRDVKPANVVLRPDGQPVLLDLGLALLLESSARLTRSGELLGTPAYMAPEQAEGDRGAIGPACDVYGLGALLWALLCGRDPFQGSGPLAVLQQVLTSSPPAPSRLRPGLDPRVDGLVMACLGRDPLTRPGLAEVQTGLEALRRAPARRRRRRGALFASLAVTLLLGGGLGAWWGTRPRAGPLIAEGRALLARGDHAGARARLEEAARIDPQDPAAWDALGVACAGVRDVAAAREALDRALTLDPRRAGTLANRASLRSDLGDLEGALADLDQAIALDPLQPEPFFLRAMVRAAGERPDVPQLEADLDRALALEPDHAPALALRAVARRRRGDPGWEQDLERAIRLDAPHSLPHVVRASLRVEAGDLAGALADAEEAVRRAPGRPDGYQTRGRLRARLGDLRGARADLARAAELLAPGSHDQEAALRELEALQRAAQSSTKLSAEARRLGVRGDPGALHELDRVLAHEPDHVEALALRGRVHQCAGRLEAALRDLDRAVGLDPRHEWAHLFRAVTLGSMKREEEGLRDLDRVLELDPDHGLALLTRAQMRLAARRPEEALEDYRRLERLEPENPDVPAGAAQALIALRRPAEAEAALDQALALRAGFSYAQALRGILRLGRGAVEGGLADLESAVELDPLVLQQPDLRRMLEVSPARSDPATRARIEVLLGRSR